MKISKSKLKELVKLSIREAEEWWDKLEPDEKAAYIKAHPKSQKAMDAKAKSKKKSSSIGDFFGSKADKNKEKIAKAKKKDDDSFDVGGPSYANVPKGVKSSKDIGKTPQPSDFDGDMDKYLDALNKHMKDVEAKLDKGDKPAFKKPSDMGSGQGMMKTGYDEPTAADDVESNWDKSSKEFESLEDKHGVRIDDQSDWSGIENNPRGEYSVSGQNSEDPGDGFSIYSTVETGVDGESYEGNKNIITFPQDNDPFGGAVEVQFDSIGDAKDALDKILGDKKIKSALDGGRADMANNKDYIKKQVEKLGGKTIRESVRLIFNESVKPRRSTIREIKRWMKTLEENRYRKIVQADARRVAWFVNNNLAEDYEQMPKSIVKKWPKAAYKRERYLAKEFLNYKKSKVNEMKLTRGNLRRIILETIKKQGR